MASPQPSEGKALPPELPLIMRYAARSDVGRVRSKNDDSAYAGRHLAVVADGMGGHAGGDVASASTVLDMIHLDHDSYPDGAETVLADEIQTANSLLSELVHVDPKLAGMGTTVTALLLEGRRLHFAHIGDSRAYRLRNGKFEQISVDHTFVQRLIDEGRLRPEEAETHPHKNVLMRVLGDVDASPELDLDELDVEPGERWLLCSDGLNYVQGAVVEQVVRETKDLAECAELLIELTLANGAPDNVTVVLLEIVEETGDNLSTAAVDVVPEAQVPPKAADPAKSAPSKDSAHGSDAAAKKSGANSPAASGVAPAVAPPETKSDVGPSAAAEPAAPGPVAGSAKPAGTTEPPTATDPHLGEHLSAEILREELASRPHELVGAAATAADTGSIPTIAGRSVARRAATVLTHKAEQDRQDPQPLAARKRRWLTPAIAAVLAIFVVAGLWLGYAWTQTRYYVGEFNQHVAIFNGISQSLGPFQLSKVEATTNIRMDSLPEFTQQVVRQTVPARDLADAQQIVKNLQEKGTTGLPVTCPTGTAKPTASPSPTTGPTPASPSPSNRPTSSPTSTAVPTCAVSP
ncbi:PP2C family protein-serine/threonine phosphatase [Arthrobacter bambusae]|uniref:Protein phosphatase n=1 Tax=Arthrobacter bambusae TaxID=1338426 RepID=A0AAW8DEL8_9MICC|nr:PP2C family serine/threonine-protein phosphatase [Arthrobacter bambusae]MDP9906832.1 protein phosphatase [Arthrobacter bambusae]MDQ0130988.1 protein phosphatase [Arthrobacter bambusae]MDQ0182510.1 protein phosphatase [Arthrobacter bambusae]